MSDFPPRDGDLPAGYDEEDPYDEDSLSAYPAWWRRNVELFESLGMRPYHPSKFDDGETVPDTIQRLEEKYDVEIRLRVKNPHESDAIEVVVGGDVASAVRRSRQPEGYTQYHVTTDEFESIVADGASERTTE